MIVDATLGACGAVARADAAVVLASKVVGALAVGRALGPLALLVRVAEEAVLAVTARFVETVDLAERVNAALGDQAGVDTLAVDAGLGQRALVVAATANCIEDERN